MKKVMKVECKSGNTVAWHYLMVGYYDCRQGRGERDRNSLMVARKSNPAFTKIITTPATTTTSMYMCEPNPVEICCKTFSFSTTHHMSLTQCQSHHLRSSAATNNTSTSIPTS